jgi:hypothetical protein
VDHVHRTRVEVVCLTGHRASLKLEEYTEEEVGEVELMFLITLPAKSSVPLCLLCGYCCQRWKRSRRNNAFIHGIQKAICLPYAGPRRIIEG